MTALNICVIGQAGQLARALASRSKMSSHNIQCYGRNALDLTSEYDAIAQFIGRLNKADIIINAAAYTAVDNAEDDKATAYQVNAEAPGMLAKLCSSRKIPFVHVSTDYVFNGKKSSPYLINDPTEPLGVYGASKLAGEQAVLKAGGHSAILRTSWVYDGTGKNFFTTMLRLAQERKELSVVSDQFGRPTYAGHLADAVLCTAEALARRDKAVAGIFHVSGRGDIVHWADFAKSIFEISRGHRAHDVVVNEITSADYPTRAKRPNYSALDVSHFEETLQMKLHDWRDGLKEAYYEWVAAQG